MADAKTENIHLKRWTIRDESNPSGQHHDDFFPSNTRLWRVVLGIYMNISARSATERLKCRRLRNKRLMLRLPLTRAISANISASIVSRVCGCDHGIPIISQMNVYTPNERLFLIAAVCDIVGYIPTKVPKAK
jgi:hypothetical protein